ncbi:unnamed protein product [Rotaria sp. Silwood2]|nr:unnamed protein product [Rotaria sp. Silwood2]CAF3274493.1 unnamed protein product [Rotaria sp. Silwood2]CAF3974961.1 unnamed protein product [Rotaria sp. Silwood2]CAF4233215.1 unnamed protein product [Rotaria sp. Silwood2]
MVTQSNKQQLVLFDGDDHRTELFQDIKQLLMIPFHCEFYIFCNDTDSIQSKILNHISDISQVRVRRSTESISQRLLDFIQTNIDKYSFILIVCGSKPTYEHVFKNIWKKYGRKKLFVMQTNDQSHSVVKDILTQLRQHRSQSNNQASISNNTQVYADNEYSQSVNLIGTQQKTEKIVYGSLLDKEIYMDLSANDSFNKKNNRNNKLIVQSGIHCSNCNEDFPSMRALRKHIEDECLSMTQDDYE